MDRHRLGGNDHLNACLGEYVRTYRILRAFGDSMPDKSGMYHCLRAFGRFDDALKLAKHHSASDRMVLCCSQFLLAPSGGN